MRRFILKVILFLTVIVFLIFLGVFLPATPSSSENMLSFKKQKDSLLLNVKSPRIIFVGGSSLVFGINSNIVKDSLKINPINNGMAITIGLIYMMDDVLKYVNEGDLIVLAPEYQLFFGNSAYGNYDLFRLLMDVEREGFKQLRVKHYPNMAKIALPYFFSKFDINNYIYDNTDNPYSKYIFNEYGDSFLHWKLKKKEFNHLKPIIDPLNYEVIKEIEVFKKKVNDKGGKVFLSYPGCSSTSLEIINENVKLLEKVLIEKDLNILGTPELFSYPDSLIFDHPYHLTKEGVDQRTKTLINELKKSL